MILFNFFFSHRLSACKKVENHPIFLFQSVFVTDSGPHGINSITRATNLPNFPIKGSNKALFSSRLIWTRRPRRKKTCHKNANFINATYLTKVSPWPTTFHFSHLGSMWPRKRSFSSKVNTFQTVHEGPSHWGLMFRRLISKVIAINPVLPFPGDLG